MRRSVSSEALAGRCVLRGGSMSPTLREGDVLLLETAVAGTVLPGDVIAFAPPATETLIVHRVVGNVDGYFVTRGDGATSVDGWRIGPARVAGRVVCAWRGGKKVPVAGGRRGRLQAAASRLGGMLRRHLAAVTGPVRSLLPEPGWASGLLPAAARPRVVRFAAGGDAERRLLVGTRVAGRYDSRQGVWRIRCVFRPFVRIRTLPGE